MTTLETLRRARDLISDQKNWTQGAFARQASGVRCEPSDSGATCWCSAGAILSVDGVATTIKRCPALAELCAAIGGGSVVIWNDTPERQHAEILEAFDRAIAHLEEEHG